MEMSFLPIKMMCSNTISWFFQQNFTEIVFVLVDKLGHKGDRRKRSKLQDSNRLIRKKKARRIKI